MSRLRRRANAGCGYPLPLCCNVITARSRTGARFTRYRAARARRPQTRLNEVVLPLARRSIFGMR